MSLSSETLKSVEELKNVEVLKFPPFVVLLDAPNKKRLATLISRAEETDSLTSFGHPS